MKQFVRGGALAAWTWVLMTGCGSDPGTSTGGMTVTPPAAGTAAAPATSPAGSGAKAGTTAPSTGGTLATAGTSAATAGVSASAGGATAAAGTSAAGSGTAGMSAAAGAGAAGTKGAASGGAAGSGSGGGAATAGCGSESFAAIYETILKNATYNCAGPLCHGREPGNVAPVGDLSLSSASIAYMQLTAKTTASMSCAGKTRVVPGDPAASLLVQKLRGDTTMCGGVMPIGADEISEADLKRVTDWIKGGACNN